jgi:divalent metal cation (Fe/Co/Zn/Cd) transporter
MLPECRSETGLRCSKVHALRLLGGGSIHDEQDQSGLSSAAACRQGMSRMYKATTTVIETTDRASLAGRARRLEYFTILWNSLEGLVGVATGVMAGSVSLVGFGVDSFIEVTSGAALLWRMAGDGDHCQRERRETRTLKIVGACFLALAAYVAADAGWNLWSRSAASPSTAGIVLAAASLVTMPLLSRAKRRVARGLSSGAMHADARQTEFCTYLSAILLGGLLVNALFGWWWADSIAALVMTPIIAREGVDGLRGRACCD